MTNLPYMQKNNLITRIKQFFRKLFYKKEKNTKKEEMIETIKQNDFRESIETQVKNNYLKEEKKQLIESIEKNPNLLYNLSLSRLENLENYYDELIEQDKLELKKIGYF